MFRSCSLYKQAAHCLHIFQQSTVTLDLEVRQHIVTTKMLFLLFVAVLPLSTLAADQHQYPNVTDVVRILFADADENGDGSLTLREFIDSFIKFDLNGDDRISHTELVNDTLGLAPELEGLEKALFTLLDADRDHHLEMNDYVKFYNAIDTDGNGRISEEQYMAYFASVYKNLIRAPAITG